MNRINRAILQLWESTPNNQLNNLVPGYIPPIKKEAILFIGINPSFSERGFKTILRETELERLDVKKFYKYPTSNSFDLNTSFKIEELSREKHPYFNRFREISELVGVPWEHLDLFFIRETNQKDLLKRVFKKGRDLNAFGEQQLKISKKSIDQARPKVVVVANALASALFETAFNAKFDKEQGCHFAMINGEKTPVFLCSMLTGQRALDNFSYERLCWHISEVLRTTIKA